ncbi:MAG TPA: glycerol-3-phosphate dehydrogenase [Pyrinomonadaceae bacterium]|nr:glycerol-3-phosphate dehydrogenase [Pyrinomonadaceae bacterium]
MAQPPTPDDEERLFDLAIVGGGVNGAGLARDAAMRGLGVLLLDKGDAGGGTSAWSTRLIHGGLRYLEHGELRLVREALRERETLLKIAPHLVRPLPLLIPVYAGQRRGPLLVRAGMLAYDLLSFDKTLASHRALTRDETLRLAPALRTEGLRGASLYMDAQVEFPERLVIENLLDARARGASVKTHARVTRIVVEDGRAVGVEYADELRGRAHDARGRTHEARARVVVNAAGPWVDEVLDGSPLARERLIGGTKGSHIVVAQFDGAPACAVYAEATRDARPFFVIPWQGRVLIGTTDTRHEGDLDSVAATEEEIDYLLAETNRVLPSARLARGDVLYSYAGVRPLPYTARGATAAITRRHFTRDHAPEVENFFSLVGGKLTTYRSLAEQATDLVFKKLGRSAPPCETARVPLPGASFKTGESFEQFSASFINECALPEATALRFVRVYGSRAEDLLEFARARAHLLAPLDDASDALAAEIPFAFEREMAATLTDCLMRRTMLGLNDESGLDVIEPAAEVAREYFGWGEARVRDELRLYQEYVRRFR